VVGHEEPRGTLGHKDTVFSVAFSPDSKIVASASRDKTIRLWDVATLQSLGTPLVGHSDGVYAVAFSPDGKTLASASGDRTIRLWDVTSRQALGGPLTGHTNSVLSVGFSPDGKTLVSASGDKTIRLWDVDVSSWINRACEIAKRNLTRAEWAHYMGNEAYQPTCPNLPADSQDR
jgi:WD40 repeat protein